MNTTRWLRCVGAALLVLAGSGEAAAAQQDVRSQLATRGLPPDLVNGVAAVATDAAARGLPTAPIADKALEGWAKHAPAARILTVVQAFTARMADAQVAVRSGGIASPPGEAIAAAADAMGRGMTGAQVTTVVRAGGPGADAAAALHVAAALSSQGMGMDQAVTVVSTAMRERRSSEQILDMPSVMRALQARGMTPTDIGRQLMEGGQGHDGPGGRGGSGGMDGQGPAGGSGGGHGGDGGGHGPGGNRPPDGPPPPPEGGHRPM